MLPYFLLCPYLIEQRITGFFVSLVSLSMRLKMHTKKWLSVQQVIAVRDEAIDLVEQAATFSANRLLLLNFPC